MADLYVCSSDSKTFPTEADFVHHQEVAHPKVEGEWTTDQMREDFEVIGFAMGYVVVRRRSDGVKGSLDFDHAPRRYYDFKEDK